MVDPSLSTLLGENWSVVLLDKIPVLFAPTASGKSALSLAYARETGAIILNMDSMQIYEGMDVGTAKPTAEEFNCAQHELFNITTPDKPFSVYDYQVRALEIIHQYLGKRPLILVGGTGLYLSSLYFDYAFREVVTEPTIHEDADIDWKNPHRVQRFKETGKVYKKEDRIKRDFPFKIFYLEWEREKLYERINRRVDLMVANGLVEEIEGLIHSYGLEEDSPLLKAIGYKELIPYLHGESTLEEAIEILKRNTRRYAKRQITWVKHQYPEVYTIDASLDTDEQLQLLMKGLEV